MSRWIHTGGALTFPQLRHPGRSENPAARTLETTRTCWQMRRIPPVAGGGDGSTRLADHRERRTLTRQVLSSCSFLTDCVWRRTRALVVTVDNLCHFSDWLQLRSSLFVKLLAKRPGPESLRAVLDRDSQSNKLGRHRHPSPRILLPNTGICWKYHITVSTKDVKAVR